MIKLNYIVILAILIFTVLLYINNLEHFSGALTTQNAEAVANISSMVNSGNLKVTNLEVTGNIKTVPSPMTINNGITMQSTDKEIHNISLSRSDEQDKNHTWSLWHMNQLYGQNDLSFWEYGHDKDGVSKNFGANMIIRGTNKNSTDIKPQGVTFLRGANFVGGSTTPTAEAGDGYTHFPHPNGNNYIRGNTIINGQLCIGDVCITKDHLNTLKKIVDNGNIKYVDNVLNLSFQGAKLNNMSCMGQTSKFLHQGCNTWNAFS